MSGWNDFFTNESTEASQAAPNELFATTFSESQLDLLRHIVRDRLGINLPREKDYLLISKFSRMAQDRGFTDIEAFLADLRRESHENEIALAKHLTTNHTFFFREAAHFEILTTLLLANRAISFPRIWCAANSTGEEVYTIAIVLCEAGYRDFILLGSDINLEVLKLSRRGEYKGERLREMPPHLIRKYFSQTDSSGGGTFQVRPDMLRRVLLKRLNLLDNLEFEQKFNVIFCRNVLIYFDLEIQRQVVRNLLKNLESGGYLFLGHSEPLLDAELLSHVRSVGTSVYQKK